MHALSSRKHHLAGLVSPLLVWLMLFLLIASPWVQADEISPAAARNALVDVLAGKGKVPPDHGGLNLADYINIHTATNQDGDRDVWLTVSLDKKGQIIPNKNWRDARPEYCKMQARETATPSQELLFRMHKWREVADTQSVRGLEDQEGTAVRVQYTTEARLVGLNSNGRNDVSLPSISEATWMNIQKSRYALSAPDQQMLTQTLGEAFDDLNASVRQPTEGCGETRLEHLSGEMVGAPVSFLAGYQGYYGETLNYRWDFGDGNSNDADSKQVSHTYEKGGTYEVTVHVSGKYMESGSQSISVTIKDGLVLHFSSQVSASGAETPDRTFNMAATVPLTREDDTTFTGSATLRNAGTTVHGLSQVGCAAGNTYDGRLDVRVSWPNPERKGTPQVSLTIPDGDGRPGVHVSCATSPLPDMARNRITKRIGNTWWFVFREMHAGIRQPDGSFLFENLDAGQGGGLVAAYTASPSQQVPDTGTIRDTITIELRREAAP